MIAAVAAARLAVDVKLLRQLAPEMLVVHPMAIGEKDDRGFLRDGADARELSESGYQRAKRLLSIHHVRRNYDMWRASDGIACRAAICFHAPG